MKKTFLTLLVLAIVTLLTDCRKKSESENNLPLLIAQDLTGKFYINDIVSNNTFMGQATYSKPDSSFSIKFDEIVASNHHALYIAVYPRKFELKPNVTWDAELIYKDTIATWDPFYCDHYEGELRPGVVKSGTLTITNVQGAGDSTKISGVFSSTAPLCLRRCSNDVTCACCTKPNQVSIKGGVFSNIPVNIVE